MNSKIDNYLVEGCGRCPLGGTPQCKVHNWTDELVQLRRIILDCGLNEELKWGVPCYTWKGKNIAVVAAFKEYASLSFFKGALLHDEYKLLDKPGENTQAARLIKFTQAPEIIKMETKLKAYIFEAIEIEKAGLKVDFKEKSALIYPAELQQAMDNNPTLQTAFEALTPGRQRGYILHFTQPKQAQTRTSRIEKCIPKILEGKGVNEYFTS
ncbi:YdeI/OmpD-associated family protein [Reichenbachiella agarivorans]|uniref:YdeI/OmpD-associated family protein n=1 Tax=Reichenbachiella agarivorans TaxID=2979464 RepID=A0ABY6CTE9_9BACT|nr:YdeI/OmpD-associated family protein [Reichenbachiella agarivorans]UXP32738.1 YdeI/OmpD-associated family protein [Reichenbachiella agarivorans]